MATDRLISAGAASDGRDEQRNWALRPETIEQYVGQEDLIERLRVAIGAARQRKEPCEHCLFHGPPGLGKTTLAHLIANEMGGGIHVTSGPVLSKGTDLVAALTSLREGDVLFIDEVHRLPASVEEFVYPAMEDYRIDVPVDSGLSARTVQIRCKPFTLVAATTRAGLISAPLRSRFGITHHLRYYGAAELVRILNRSSSLLGVRVESPACLELIAARSRGTPRIANRLLRRVRDFAEVKAEGAITQLVADAALTMLDVDAIGLDIMDRKLLGAVLEKFAGGPVGLDNLAAAIGEARDTIEDVLEPYLIQQGYLQRTPRGRMATASTWRHFGLAAPAAGGQLFADD